MEGAIGMKDANKNEFGKAAQKMVDNQKLVFPVLVIPQPVFACLKPIVPFKVRTGA